MSVVPLSELLDERTRLKRLTVKQYHRMIEQGILEEGEPYELLDGYVVRKDRSAAGEDPMTVGHEHAWVVKTLAKLGRKLEPTGCHIQTQQPIALPPHHEPEPDGAVVIGTKDDYRQRHPKPEDVLCVVEVADASLQRDRTMKQRIYANGGIACYLIINLQDRCIEVYRGPRKGKGRYGQSVTLSGRQSVEIPTGRGKPLNVPVRQLLP